MKRLLLFFVVILFVDVAAFAQPGGGMPGGGMPGGGGPGGGGGRPPMSMGNQQQDNRVYVNATAITEMFKKELKLDKEQYPKFRKAYMNYLNVRLSNQDDPDAGIKKLNKSMKKLLNEDQFQEWQRKASEVKIPNMKQGPQPGSKGMEAPGAPPS